MTHEPHVVAMLDQADAMFGAELDALVGAHRLGARDRGRQQMIADQNAMFLRSDRFTPEIVATLLAQAVARPAGGAS